MNFKMHNSVNLSKIKTYSNTSVNKIDYKYNEETYTPDINAQENSENEYLEIENLETSENTQTVPVEEAMERGLEQNRNNVADLFEGNEIASNAAMAAGGFVNGVGNFGENIVDAGATGAAFLASPFTFLYDQFTGSNVTEEMWEASNSFVAEEHVNNAFEDFYTNNEVGQAMNENASETMQYGNAGYNMAVGTGYLTATIASAGTLSQVSTLGLVGSGAAVSGAAGVGRGTSDALNSGATTQEALLAGGLTGLWEGGQWLFGAAISGRGLTTVALDAGSGAIDPLARSGIQTLYNDQGFIENFEQNGGVEGVITNAAIAGGFSTLGEISTIRGNKVEQPNVDIEMKSATDLNTQNITSENHHTNIEFSDSRPRVSDLELSETKIKIDDLKTSLRNNGILNDDNEIIFDSMLKSLNDGVQIDPTFKSLLLNMDVLVERIPNLDVKIANHSFGGAYNPISSTLNIGGEILSHSSGARSSFASLHEFGHTIFNNFKGTDQVMELPFGKIDYVAAPASERITTLVKNAQDQLDNNHAKVTSLLESNDKTFYEVKDEATRQYSLIEESETARINSEIDSLLSSPSDSYQLKSILRGAGIEESQIDNLLENPEQLKSVVNSNHKNATISIFKDDIASLENDNLGELQLDSMLNSVVQSEAYGDIHFKQFHPDSYWAKSGSVDGACRDSYDELVADYFAFMSSGRSDLMDKFKDITGSELTDALYGEYSSILDELKDSGTIRR